MNHAPSWGLATLGPLGHSPVAPGSVGALAALPAAWLLTLLPWPARVAVLALVTIGAIVVVQRYLAGRTEADPQEVVLDELVGCLVTLAPLPWSLSWVAAGYVLFRLLDITKPGPIGYLDRRVHGGLGVVADDVAAGVLGALILVGVRLAVCGLSA